MIKETFGNSDLLKLPKQLFCAAEKYLLPQYYHRGFEVFDTQNGLPSITPSKTIKENPFGGLDIYENINGIPGIAPLPYFR